MPASWNLGVLLWLPLLVLIGVPAFGAAVFRLARRFLRVGERQAGSISYGVAAIFILLGGVLEWGLVVDEAVWAPGLIAAHPEEFWRWIVPMAEIFFVSGLICGLGAHAVCTWHRLRSQRKSS